MAWISLHCCNFIGKVSLLQLVFFAWLWSFHACNLQGLCFLFAIILKALGPHRYYDSDDDYLPQRAPLLQNAVQDPVYGSRPNAWNARINNKVNTIPQLFSRPWNTILIPLILSFYTSFGRVENWIRLENIWWGRWDVGFFHIELNK